MFDLSKPRMSSRKAFLVKLGEFQVGNMGLMSILVTIVGRTLVSWGSFSFAGVWKAHDFRLPVREEWRRSVGSKKAKRAKEGRKAADE